MANNHEMLKVAGWLPQNPSKQVAWVNSLIAKVEAKNAEEDSYDHKEVAELRKLLDEDAILHMLASKMVSQAYKYDEKDPYGKPEVKNYKMMLRLIDYIMNTAPEYMQESAQGRGLIGFPINAVLDWCMGTQAGYAFFLEKRINACFQNILTAWCSYLNSADSTSVLNSDSNGWLCKEALEELKLEEEYQCDPNDVHYGFTSWNDFFTRQFKENARPVASPDDPYVIACACESASYRISTDVKNNQKFWLKGQPYSLEYMLNNDEHYKKFIGGTVYQAFLSATRYHRWHSPIDGTIVKCYQVPGTYYAELHMNPYDDAGPNYSQGYITHVATRAVVLIQSDNDDIGLVGFIAVGMAEVSSCVISVKENDTVKKGDELGYFQFGGSTHCLLFQKDVDLQFVDDAIPAEDFNDSTVMKVKSKLAEVKKS